MNDLWRLDATAQAALVREKSVRPIQLVEAAMARGSRDNVTALIVRYEADT